MAAFNILCVDDELINRKLLKDILEPQNYKVYLASSSQECLESLAREKADLIILDVMMPHVSGLECCETIKKTPEYHDIPVIFLSALRELEDRLRGYLAGGEDYIGKPFSPDEIIAKVKSTLARHKKLETAQSATEEAVATTMEILTTMGETNSVIAFLQQTFNCQTYAQLADKIIQTHLDWGLEIAIEISTNNDRQYYFTGDASLPLEEAAFDFIRSKGRLVDHGERTAVNYPHITILIRNMPLHDPDLYGRIKDYIAIIAQGAESKIIALINTENRNIQHNNLINIMQKTEKTLSQLDQDYKSQQQVSLSILSDIGATVEESFIHLGLTEEQENFLTEVVHNAENQTAELFDAGLALDEKFGDILSDIKNAMSLSNIDTETKIEDDTADETIAFF